VRDNIIIGAIVAAFVAAFAGVFIGLPVWWTVATCHSKWSGIGQPDWGPVQGCMVTLKDGRIIPADAIRDVTP
jgi:hypothetical protein